MPTPVASYVLVGTIIDAVIGGILTDHYGRYKMIISNGIIFTISVIGTAC